MADSSVKKFGTVIALGNMASDLAPPQIVDPSEPHNQIL